jgi:RNA polymerase sigma-70 factor (ECF subfamily)
MSPSKLTDLAYLTETEIIGLAQQGDAGAFEHLYKQHSRNVYAMCFRMAGNSSDAEELTQEAFLQVFRKIGSFRGESAFATWLHRITFNIVLARFRKKKLGEISGSEHEGFVRPAWAEPRDHSAAGGMQEDVFAA